MIVTPRDKSIKHLVETSHCGVSEDIHEYIRHADGETPRCDVSTKNKQTKIQIVTTNKTKT